MIDLHVHSKHSDGTMTPTEIIKLAKDSDLKTIALTDHDEISGIDEAIEEANKQGIKLIPGIEMTANYLERDGVHILGYYIDHNNEDLIEYIKEYKKRKSKRNRKIYDNLINEGIDLGFDPDYIDNMATYDFSYALFNAGYEDNVDDCYFKYISPEGIAYVEKDPISTKKCIELIHNAGGIAVLAHPFSYKLERPEIEKMIDDLVKLRLDGIEVYYPTNGKSKINYLLRIASEKNLIITGGSDFHGTNRPETYLGKGKIPAEMLDKLNPNLKLLLKHYAIFGNK